VKPPCITQEGSSPCPTLTRERHEDHVLMMLKETNPDIATWKRLASFINRLDELFKALTRM